MTRKEAIDKIKMWNFLDDDKKEVLETLIPELKESEGEQISKKVDLDKEAIHYLLYEHCSPLNEIMHKADLKAELQYHKDIENAFKAGFELSKTQKGE